MDQNWSKMVQKFRELAPKRVERVYPEARSKWQLYMAHLADAGGDPGAALTCLAGSIRSTPTAALANRHTWMLGSAALARFVLPGWLHAAVRHQARRVLR